MTKIYFIRHGEADNSVRDGRIRPLTEKGVSDRALVTVFLEDKGIDAVVSSPFKRAVDTVRDFAEKYHFDIRIVEDFQERTGDRDMGKSHPGFPKFLEEQWADFTYTYSDGECLGAVQERNIAALNKVLAEYRERNVVIGTHGTALSTILNHYDPTFGFEDFMAMADILPWVAVLSFDGLSCTDIQKVNLFEG